MSRTGGLVNIFLQETNCGITWAATHPKNTRVVNSISSLGVGALSEVRALRRNIGVRHEKENKGVLVSRQLYHLLGVHEVLYVLPTKLQRGLFTRGSEMKHNCETCATCGGTGWVWKMRDLDSTKRIGTSRHKGGSQTAHICPNWVGEGEPTPLFPDFDKYRGDKESNSVGWKSTKRKK